MKSVARLLDEYMSLLGGGAWSIVPLRFGWKRQLFSPCSYWPLPGQQSLPRPKLIMGSLRLSEWKRQVEFVEGPGHVPRTIRHDGV